MKLLLSLVASVLWTGIAFADIPNANKISVLKDQAGRFSFGLQYSVRPKPLIAIAFSVRGDQLVGAKASPVDPVYWAIVGKDTGGLVTPWQNSDFGAGYVTPDASEAFMVSVESGQAISVLKDLRKLAIALSLKNDPNHLKPTVYIDLGDLCDTDPDGFIDLDHGRSGCP